jgi:hypothetical protein
MPATHASRRRRPAAAGAAAAVLASGLGVHLLAPAGFASDAAGDALYAALIHLLGVLCAPRAPSGAVASAALTWCVAVELFQLTGLPESWAVAVPPLTLVFGTVFAPQDLALYAAGVAIAWGVDVAVTRAVRPRAAR